MRISVEHYENPRNVGSLDKNDNDVGTVSTDFCKAHKLVLRRNSSLTAILFYFG